MFENAGEKIKVLASVIFMLSATLFILIFISYLTQGELLSGIFILGLGIIGVWIASLFIYAFGKLVENSSKAVSLLRDVKYMDQYGINQKPNEEYNEKLPEL